jgi:type 1 glutamine amidotransferase
MFRSRRCSNSSGRAAAFGVHSATDTFYAWPDYRELIGGYFDEHPWHQAVRIEVVDPTTRLCPSSDHRCKSRT